MPVLFLQSIRGSNSSECLSEYRLCLSISRRQRLDVPCPCSSSKLIQYGHLWCFSITALLALTGFTSTQCAFVTIVHDLNVGEVISGLLHLVPSGFSPQPPHAETPPLDHGVRLGVSVYLTHRNGGLGSQEVSHPVEHMGHKGAKKALVPGTITFWKILKTNE